MTDKLSSDSDVAALDQKRMEMELFASHLVIKSPEGFVEVKQRGSEAQSALNTIEAARVKITKPINEGLREINRQAKEASAPWQKIRDAIDRALLTYAQEQERKRIEQQEKLDREAEAERRRLSAISMAADEKGQEGKADRFAERARHVVAPIVPSNVPKVPGLTMPKRWTWRITDENKIPRTFLKVDEAKIGKVVAALQGGAHIEGIEIYQETGVSLSGKSSA